MIGGTPTHIATIMPIRVPRSRLLHPVAVEFPVVVDPDSPVLVSDDELPVEGPAVAPPPVVAEAGGFATGPTAIVVVDVGRLGYVSSLLASQVSITAAIAPWKVAQQ
jgi:hypothetical protein